MRTNTNAFILQLLLTHKELSPHELASLVGIGKVALHRQLNKLLSKGLIKKVGRPPRVIYSLKHEKHKKADFLILPRANQEIVDKTFIVITPDGKQLRGVEAFKLWCEQRGFNTEDKIVEFLKIYKKYNQFKDTSGLIDGMEKMRGTFREVHLDELYYLDFYSWEIFGKTKLGTLVLFAKQSQNKGLINSLIGEVRPNIEKFIRKHRITALGFIPPTEKREIQLMKSMEKTIAANLPRIKVEKILTDIIIPQKSLSRLVEREVNAEETFTVKGGDKYRNVLLIDDAVGSGATMNTVARKLKEKKLVEGKVIGLAIVGSFKGFDVISRV